MHGAVYRTPIPCTANPDASWFMREVPYSWQMLAENVSDPSHVPFSHHGVLGACHAQTTYKLNQHSLISPILLPQIRFVRGYTHSRTEPSWCERLL